MSPDCVHRVCNHFSFLLFVISSKLQAVDCYLGSTYVEALGLACSQAFAD